MRANLHLDSAVFRHAVRLAMSLTVAEIVAHRVGWSRPYWIPMTVAIVLQPRLATIVARRHEERPPHGGRWTLVAVYASTK